MLKLNEVQKHLITFYQMVKWYVKRHDRELNLVLQALSLSALIVLIIAGIYGTTAKYAHAQEEYNTRDTVVSDHQKLEANDRDISRLELDQSKMWSQLFEIKDNNTSMKLDIAAMKVDLADTKDNQKLTIELLTGILIALLGKTMVDLFRGKQSNTRRSLTNTDTNA